MTKKVETGPAPYNRKRIAWELERTAMGDGYYGNALRAAKDFPEATPAVRSLLDRWATGKESGLSDRTDLCAFALQIYAADGEPPQPPAEAHCATCSCVPGMTPAVRFDTTPAEREGAVRDHLIRMGWTPPAEAQPVGVEGFRDWVIEQMPAGTVIDNPELWAERLARAYELNVPPPSAPVGAGEVDCRCVDCGGNQPGHDPTCSYMHELHGEAQPVGHGCGDHDHADYIPGCGACAATLPEKRTAQPPSAPVGVEGVRREIQNALRELDAVMTAEDNTSDAVGCAELALQRALEALAQQPAAAGEEIMVNAAHDVYTLPLQPSGLSSGPRFVVHVPGPEQPAAPVLAKHQPCGCVICTCEDEQKCQGCGAKHCGNRADHPPYVGQQPTSEVYVDFPQVGTAGPLAVVDGKVTLPDATMNDLIRHARTGYVEQPAAVDDLTNAWRAAFAEERAMRYREDGMKIEQARIHAETDATLMEQVARQQQGGSDNGR